MTKLNLMNPLSLIKSQNECFEVNVGIENLKQILNRDGKKFHFKWQTENRFIVSLNFSFGSNLLFDTNYHNTKSDIIANGNVTEINHSKTKIALQTKSKYWLTLILIVPLIMLTLELSMNLGIPIPFYFVFPIGFILILNLVNKEDKRLIRKFKEYLNGEINNALQQHL